MVHHPIPQRTTPTPDSELVPPRYLTRSVEHLSRTVTHTNVGETDLHRIIQGGLMNLYW